MDVYIYLFKKTNSPQETISKDLMNFIIWGGGVWKKYGEGVIKKTLNSSN